MAERRGEGPLDPGGAKVHGVAAHLDPELTGEGGDAGFAIRARHRDHGLGLILEPERGGKGERLSRIFGNDHGDTAGRQNVGCKRCAFAVGQNRPRLHPDGILDEFRTVGPRAGKRREKMALFHVAAIDGKTRHPRLTAAARRQPELSQRLRLCSGLHASASCGS